MIVVFLYCCNKRGGIKLTTLEFLLILFLLAMGMVIFSRSRDNERKLSAKERLETKYNERCKNYIERMESPKRKKVLLFKNLLLFPLLLISWLYGAYSFILLIQQPLYQINKIVIQGFLHMIPLITLAIPMIIISVNQSSWEAERRDDFLKYGENNNSHPFDKSN